MGQSSGPLRAVAVAGSASNVKVCQCAWSSNPLSADTSSLPVGVNWISKGLTAWNGKKTCFGIVELG